MLPTNMRLNNFAYSVFLTTLAAADPIESENVKGDEKRHYLRGLLVPPVPSGERLRNLAANIPRGTGGSDRFRIGYASRIGFSTDADYKTVAAREYDKLTHENEMKMYSLQPTEGNFNFGPADQHFAFADSNGMDVHGHTLVYHTQNPSWITGSLSEMQNHISTVVHFYKDRVAVWDVVNEPFDSGGNLRTDSIWQQNIGDDYVGLALQEAHGADPSAKLIINDYNVATINSKSTGMLNLVTHLLDQSIPLHGVGFQCHLTENGMDYGSFADNMQRFADLGLEIYITELDVRIPDNGNTGRLLQRQANVYANVVRKCMEQPMCMELSTWGFTDRHSWIPLYFDREGRALPFDENYQAKSAYYAIQTVLEEYQGTTSTPAPPSSTPAPPPSPTPPSGPVARVESVSVTVWQNTKKRKQARARVTIVDEHGGAVANARVEGQWSDATNDFESSTTDSNGITDAYSDKISAGGTFTHCVTMVFGMAWDGTEVCGSVDIA